MPIIITGNLRSKSPHRHTRWLRFIIHIFQKLLLFLWREHIDDFFIFFIAKQRTLLITKILSNFWFLLRISMSLA